jgi:flagellar hook-length control protein FliK
MTPDPILTPKPGAATPLLAPAARASQTPSFAALIADLPSARPAALQPAAVAASAPAIADVALRGTDAVVPALSAGIGSLLADDSDQAAPVSEPPVPPAHRPTGTLATDKPITRQPRAATGKPLPPPLAECPPSLDDEVPAAGIPVPPTGRAAVDPAPDALPGGNKPIRARSRGAASGADDPADTPAPPSSSLQDMEDIPRCPATPATARLTKRAAIDSEHVHGVSAPSATATIWYPAFDAPPSPKSASIADAQTIADPRLDPDDGPVDGGTALPAPTMLPLATSAPRVETTRALTGGSVDATAPLSGATQDAGLPTPAAPVAHTSSTELLPAPTRVPQIDPVLANAAGAIVSVAESPTVRVSPADTVTPPAPVPPMPKGAPERFPERQPTPHATATPRASLADPVAAAATAAAPERAPTDRLLRARPNTAFAADIAAPPAEPPVMLPAAAIAAAAPTPIDTGRQQWLTSMIDRIEVLAGSDPAGARETRITLSPDALGEVSMRLVETDRGIEVAIDAATPEARALLAEAAPRLADMAEARGLRLAPQTGGDPGDGRHRAPPQPQSDAPVPNRRAQTLADPASADERIA